MLARDEVDDCAMMRDRVEGETEWLPPPNGLDPLDAAAVAAEISSTRRDTPRIVDMTLWRNYGSWLAERG